MLFIEMLAVLQAVSPVYILLAEFLIAYTMVLLLFRFCGREGLLIYITMAVIIANIQVLKPVQFPFYAEPIPLGTVLFVSTFLANQIINEHYGKEFALQAVKISFIGYFCFVLLITLTMAFKPIAPEMFATQEQVFALEWAFPVQKSLEVLFTPAPSILIASLFALLVGQLLNVYVFSKLICDFKGGALWIRSLIASSLGNLVDNSIFSFVAFVLFAQNPLSWKVLIFSYIFGVFIMRFVMALLETPMLYLSYKFRPKNLKIKQKSCS